MRLLISLALLGLFLVTPVPQLMEAPTGFDNKSNGVADDTTHQADQTTIERCTLRPDGRSNPRGIVFS